MLVREIVDLLEAKPLLMCNDTLLDSDYEYAFATDLMSDALAMIQTSPEKFVLITGLANASTIRTAEMLDLHVIIIVRGKTLDEETLNIAKESELNIFATDHSMYCTSGILYANGLKGINDQYSS